MSDVEPIMPNIVNMFPLTWLSSKFNNNKPEVLDQEYLNFIDKYDNLILVSFGTTFVPSNET